MEENVYIVEIDKRDTPWGRCCIGGWEEIKEIEGRDESRSRE